MFEGTQDMTPKKKLTLLRCRYCLQPVTVADVRAVDHLLETMEGEAREFLLDHLPPRDTLPEVVDTHITHFSFPIVNLCLHCLDQAMEKLKREETN